MRIMMRRRRRRRMRRKREMTIKTLSVRLGPIVNCGDIDENYRMRIMMRRRSNKDPEC